MGWRARNMVILVLSIAIVAGFLLAGSWLTARAIVDLVSSVKIDETDP